MGFRNRYKNRKDQNQSEIVKGLRDAGLIVRVLDTPCDLLVRKRDEVQPTFIDCKTLQGKRTPAQKAFDEDFPNVVHYWRSLTECLIGLGIVVPEYDFKVAPYDEAVCVNLSNVRGNLQPIITALWTVKGVRTMTGRDNNGDFLIWPKKGFKVEPLAKRIHKLLDERRIAAR